MKGTRKVKNVICKRFFLDPYSEIKRSVLLAGMGRSGTTWVSDIINHDNSYRFMREPFLPSRVRLMKDFEYNQYLRVFNKDKRFLVPAEKMFSGQIRNQWVDNYNLKFFAEKRLIKTIRGVLMLGWIYENFPEMPIVLLLRNPYALAASWRRMNWGTELDGIRKDLDICMSQEELVKDYLGPFRTEIEKCRDDYERHIMLWCIKHHVFFRQFRVGKAHLVFYENFVRDPEKEIREMFDYIGRDYDDSVIAGLKRPSLVIKADSPLLAGKDPVTSWRDYVSDKDINNATRILSLFGLDMIYSLDSSMPDRDKANILFSGD